VFALSKDVETCPLEGSHYPFVRDLGQFGHTATSTVRSFFNRLRSSMLAR
jgi:hypothetical protein